MGTYIEWGFVRTPDGYRVVRIETFDLLAAADEELDSQAQDVLQ